jgi:hypothetical protein
LAALKSDKRTISRQGIREKMAKALKKEISADIDQDGEIPLIELGKTNPQQIKREILHICFTSTSLSYHEIKYMFLYNALEDEKCINQNMLGRFFREKI